MARPKSTFDRKILLATVSITALALAGAQHAQAADVSFPAGDTHQPDASGAAPYVWVSLEGRYDTFTDSEMFDFAEPFDWDPDDGWSAGLELGIRPAGSLWDYVGRLVYGQAEGDDTYQSISGSVEEDHIVADFEVGRHIGVGLPGGNTRVHAGVRLVHFDAGLNLFENNVLANSYHQKINALGPRIGVDQAIPIAGNLSVDLSAAGAVLFGQREREKSAFPSYALTDDVTVWNAEASAGITYRLTHGAATLGYRIDAFWDLYGDFATVTLLGDDRITHGPFAKLTVDLAGSDN